MNREEVMALLEDTVVHYAGDDLALARDELLSDAAARAANVQFRDLGPSLKPLACSLVQRWVARERIAAAYDYIGFADLSVLYGNVDAWLADAAARFAPTRLDAVSLFPIYSPFDMVRCAVLSAHALTLFATAAPQACHLWKQPPCYNEFFVGKGAMSLSSYINNFAHHEEVKKQNRQRYHFFF